MKKEKGKTTIQKTGGKHDIQITDTNSLLKYALQSKAGVEQMKEILKMKYEDERREAEKLFHEKFCEMQSELPVIPKTKKVYSKAKTLLYSYAPLEEIVKGIRPLLKEYKFAIRWSEEFPEKNIIRIFFHISGYGHTETCHIDLPIMDSNGFVNQLQQVGSTSTYGKRYSIMGMLGIMADEDDDGRSVIKKAEPVKDESKEDMKNVTPEVLKHIMAGDLITFGQSQGKKWGDMDIAWLEWAQRNKKDYFPDDIQTIINLKLEGKNEDNK